MPGFIDARCPNCDAKIGWMGRMVDRPACPKCGHRPPQAELEAPSFADEKAFMAWIVGIAKVNGYVAYHTLWSKGSKRGFPDLTLARMGGPLIFIECKMDDVKTTPAQRAWGHILRSVGGHVRYFLWRPADWAEIVLVLTEKTHGQ